MGLSDDGHERKRTPDDIARPALFREPRGILLRAGRADWKIALEALPGRRGNGVADYIYGGRPAIHLGRVRSFAVHVRFAGKRARTLKGLRRFAGLRDLNDR